MSPIRLPKLTRLTSTIEGIRDRFSRKGHANGKHTKYRRLLCDPLEQRQLLSVSPADVRDILVTEPVSLDDIAWQELPGAQSYSYTYVNPAPVGNQATEWVVTVPVFATQLGEAGTNSAQSTAMDDDGDFVVTYTRQDSVGRLMLNPDGSIPGITVDFSTSDTTQNMLPTVKGAATYDSITDPDTGATIVDTNVYARYFTDEVQRITLPESMLTDPAGGQFFLLSSGTVKQKLTISSDYMPFSGSESAVSGSFWLTFDADSNGTISGSETVEVNYDSSASIETNLYNIKAALSVTSWFDEGSLEVRAINNREFEIEYKAQTTGTQPLLKVSSEGTDLEGFLPSVTMSTITLPTRSYMIRVSADDPYSTATSIQTAFGATGSEHLIAPTEFPPPERISRAEGPYVAPETMWTTSPVISVKPVLGLGADLDGRVFDITFTGVSGKIDQPEMKVVDANRQAIAGATVETLKQTTEEFRVNPVEFDNQSTTTLPDVYDQTSPAVAMDADGDFVITWTSQVPDSANFGTVTDVFARRFSPMGLNDSIDESSRGYVTDGIVSWVDDVQTITFDFGTATGPFSGKFKLKIGDLETEEINFNSNNLLQVAEDIEDRLVKIGYSGVQVTSLSIGNLKKFEFEVEFASRSGGVRQDNIELAEADTDLRLQTLTTVHEEDNSRYTSALFDGEDQDRKWAELSTFQVNTTTTNGQGEPAIGMDDYGNFVIAWASRAQDLSFFNGIYAQRYDRYGGLLGTEFLVFQEDTSQHFDPYVALSNSGNVVVSWTETADPRYNLDLTYLSSVNAKVYDKDGNVLRNQFSVGGGGGASVSFDSNDNWVIAWDVIADSDANGTTSNGVHAIMHNLDASQTLRSEFRVNSASLNTGSTTAWPNGQGNPQALVDADGDLIVTYEGFGPDVSENAAYSVEFYNYLYSQINATTNSDLFPLVSSWALNRHPGTYEPGYEGYSSFGSNGDVDGVIDEILINAWSTLTREIEQETDPNIKDQLRVARSEKIGRLRAIFENGLGLLRGEAYGAMYSSWDAAPGWNTATNLSSDNVINAYRDGQNQRYLVSLDGAYEWVSFVLRVWNEYLTGYTDVTVTVSRPDNVFDPVRTAQNINAALESVLRLGNNWPESYEYEGSVDVRLVRNEELVARAPSTTVLPEDLDPEDYPYDFANYSYNSTTDTWVRTPWFDAADYVYEITFQGEVHDTLIELGRVANTSVVLGEESQQLTITAEAGVTTPFDGYFTLTLPASGSTPAEHASIYFNSENLQGTVNMIRAAVRSFRDDAYEDATVQLVQGDSGGGPWVFQIDFNNTTDVPALRFTREVISGEGEPIEYSLKAVGWVDTLNNGGDTEGPPPGIQVLSSADAGTSQYNTSSAMETDGDFVTSWTQWAYRSSDIYYRRFDESTDTAGPRISDVTAPTSSRPGYIDDGVTIYVGANGLKYVVLTFDEDMMTTGADSVTNPLNYQLLRNGVALDGAIVKVEYGLSKASELAGLYGLNTTPSNKYEAVLTIDGDGYEGAGSPSLGAGDYSIVALAPVVGTDTTPARSGLRDRAGNALGRTGFAPNGENFQRNFSIRDKQQSDDPGTDPTDPDPGPGPGGYDGVDGHTHPENPGAVAVDGDGDHIRVWTAYDAASGFDRVYVAMYDASGSLATIEVTPGQYAQLLPFTVTEGAVAHHQQNASVACDKDGDFIVTWTQYDDDGDGGEDANIYAQRFNSRGERMGGAFLVNTYTINQQKWSNVAMDADGDFVITWSSNSQEDNNQLGSGYGVYARRYDSFGQPLTSEFLVNTTTAGEQRFSNVAMGADGSFVITWTSNQNGNEDIFARAFDENGVPRATPLTGEVRVNSTTAGNQMYADISSNLDGTTYVITWSSANQDGNGWGVYGRLFDQSLTATSTEILVNTTTAGDQHYSSVAMASNDTFVVTWSGRGEQTSQEDDFGVYYQRFDATGAKTGTETRVNNALIGTQYLSSIGCDSEGNFVIVWTGTGSSTGSTEVYRYVSLTGSPAPDNVGPIVTDVFGYDSTDASYNRLFAGDVVVSADDGLRIMRVAFDERLSTLDLAAGQHSVLNPANWVLQRNGTEIIGAIKSVAFTRDPVTRKYVATLTLDGNGLSTDPIVGGVSVTPALSAGEYVLTVRDSVWDASSETAGNPLDGDLDGTPGTTAGSTGYAGFSFRFSVADAAQLGAESRVNENPQYEQRISEAYGTGNGKEETNRAIAVDHDGDYVVVWTSYGQDENGEPTGAGVYYRVFRKDGTPLTGELRATTTTVGNQRDASVAIDADGDFVIVWEGQNEDGTYDIYGRRFDSKGDALGEEFRVNSNFANNQVNPAVSMDNDGNFVVVWATVGQDFSYFNDIHGQRYNSRGERMGSEFVSTAPDNPGAGSIVITGYEMNPAVALADTGRFIVAWEQAWGQDNGVIQDSEIYGQAYDFATGQTVGGTELLSFPMGIGGSETRRSARNPQIAVSDNLDRTEFVVVWESWELVQDSAGSNYGIGFGQYWVDEIGTGIWQTDTSLVADVSMRECGGEQVNPSIGMDADGDFVIVWNGAGGEPDRINTNVIANWDDEGIFLRRYHPEGDNWVLGNSEPVDVQTRVNRTTAGVQQFPSVGMSRNGDYVVVWSGRGVGDEHGIFVRRYDEATDTAGPMVTDFLFGNRERIEDGAQVTESLSEIKIVFDEDMWNSGANSVNNAANYHLLKDGVEVIGGIAGVTFDLNDETNKYEATVLLDGDGAAGGIVALGEGQYEIVIDNNLRDVAGNVLEFSANSLNGNSYSRSFNITVIGDQSGEQLVNTVTTGDQTTRDSAQPVASDDDGNYVAVYTSSDAGNAGVWARVYRTEYQAGSADARSSQLLNVDTLVQVSTNATATNAAVAMDGDGDFVVTWSQQDDGNWNVWARRFKATGDDMGEAFRVNTYTDSVQRDSTVAMDENGDFIIAWQSLDQDGSGYGIYAQRYSPAGNPIGGTNEIQVLQFANSPAGAFTLTWNHDNDPTTAVVDFGTFQFNGNLFDTVDQIEQALNAKYGYANPDADAYGSRPFEVAVVSQTEIAIRFQNEFGSKDQPQMIVGLAGSTASVTIRTATEGSSGEFRVNDTIEQNQAYASAAMNAEGDIVITWTGYGQDGDTASQSNIYAKTLPRNSSVRATTAQTSLNATTWSSALAGAEYQTYVVSSDAPANHVVDPGTGFDGVASVQWFGSTSGTGTLLTTGRHVLTASHVVADGWGNANNPQNYSVRFDTADGPVVIQATAIYVHPDYDGNPFAGSDVAVIELAEAAPASIARYDIYREQDEVGQEFSRYGYGMNGTGDIGSLYFDDLKRTGENRYDALAGILGSSDVLVAYDFDGPYAWTDAFGSLFGINDVGMGNSEVSGAPGDSGGPSFIDGKIAGVCTGGISLPGLHDYIPGIQSSWGDFGVDTRVSVYANWIDTITAGSSEFLVNETTDGNQMWSSVAMDSDGDFVVTWTASNQDGVGDGYGATANGKNGVFARRYGGSGGGSLGSEFQVNSYAADDQQHSRVAMDADGDFIIVWESYGQGTETTDYGIHAQRYARSELLGQQTWLGANGEIGGEFRINTTTAGNQRFPGVAMDDTGDYVVVWSGAGTGDNDGVFLQWVARPTDDAGPTVTNVYDMIEGSSSLHQMLDEIVLDRSITTLLINVGEDLATEGGISGTNSVWNPNNWQLTLDGEVMDGAITVADYRFNDATGKYEIRLQLDSDPSLAGQQALEQGTYVLTMQDQIEDIFGNKLDGNFDGKAGGDFGLTFSVFTGALGDGGPSAPGTPSVEDEDSAINMVLTGVQEDAVVASDAQGNYVAVWVSYSNVAGMTGVEANIVAQRFDRSGQKIGTEFQVNTHASGNQVEADVAMDDFGNFVVVWSGKGEEDTAGIYARRFDASGNALDEEEFCVNVYRNNGQQTPAVAMDANGDFVVTWSGAGNGDTNGVYARRYNFLGQPKDNAPEFLVNTFTTNSQRDADVAMDDNGNFAIVWMSEGQDGNSWGVYGQRYNAAGQKLGTEFLVNQQTSDKQRDPQIAMDADGDFAVVWSSFNQDGGGYGVYARRYSKAGAATTGEFRVNQTTTSYQHQAAVSMDDAGSFVVTWTTYGQEGSTSGIANNTAGIFARRFSANGTALEDEWRVNATTAGDQVKSAVAMDEDGDFTVVWVGPDYSGTGIFQRVVAVNPSTYVPRYVASGYGYDRVGTVIPYAESVNMTVTGTTGDDLFEFVAGPTRGSWVVKLNGVVQTIASDVTAIHFDGLGGEDTVKITGTAADESAELWPDHLVFTGTDYTVQAVNIEIATIDGKGGTDTGLFHDSDGDDLFQARSSLWATLKTASGTLRLDNFDEVEAQSTAGGKDVAWLYDSAGDDTFDAGPTSSVLAGTGFRLEASGFEEVHGIAQYGGTDKANLSDSTGNEHLVGWTGETRIYGSNYYLRAKGFGQALVTATGGYDTAELYDSAGDDTFQAAANWWATVKTGNTYLRVDGFDRVTAEAKFGGKDVAWLYDSAGDDTFDGAPKSSVLAGTGFRLEAKNFEEVHAIAEKGGTDKAAIVGSTGNEHLVGWTGETRLYGGGYYLRSKGFDEAIVTAGGGYDTAELYDSAGDDTFQAAANWWATVKTGNTFLRADGFDQVTAEAKFGGKDVAWLNDSAGDDTFEGGPKSSVLAGAGFRLEAKSFEEVHAIAKAGGTDKANIVDSTGNEHLVGWTGETRLYGSNYYLRSQGFDEALVTATGGYDTAELYDSAGDDTFQAAANWWATVKTGNTYLRVDNFDQVTAEAKFGGKDVAWLNDSAGNDTFQGGPTSSTLAGAGFRLEAKNFEEVHAIAKAGGTDTATFADTLGNEQLIGWTGESRLYGSNFYLRAQSFDSVYATSSGGHDTAKLYGSAGDDLFTSNGSIASLKGTGYYLETTDFDELEVFAGAGTNDRAELSDATIREGSSLPDGVTANYLAWLAEFEDVKVKREAPQDDEPVDATDKIFATWG